MDRRVAADLVRGRDSARSTELLIGLGIAVGVPPALTGLRDWFERERSRSEVRRVGVLHGATNSTVLAPHVASLVRPRRGE